MRSSHGRPQISGMGDVTPASEIFMNAPRERVYTASVLKDASLALESMGSSGQGNAPSSLVQVPTAPSQVGAHLDRLSTPATSRQLASSGGRSGLRHSADSLKTTSDLVKTSVLLAPPSEFRADSLFWTSFEAIEECSTGGNGIWRPYGRFVAGRAGDGLAIWERSALPKALGRSPTRHYHQDLNLFETERRMATGEAWGPAASGAGGGAPLEQGGTGEAGRNVTKFNVEKKMYNSRLWKPSRITIKSKLNFRGVDTVQKFDPIGFKRPGPMFSPRQHAARPPVGLPPNRRPGPPAPPRGTDMAKPSRFTATFLTEVPESRRVPANLRVGTGRGTEQAFLNNPRFHHVWTAQDKQVHERLHDLAVLDPVAAERLPETRPTSQYNFGRVGGNGAGIVQLPKEHRLPRRGYVKDK